MTTSDVVQDLGRIGMPDSIFREIAQRAADEIVAEKALADDLALALGLWIKYGRPPVQAAEAMARYKAARGIEESRWDEVKERADAALARHRKRHDG